MGERGLGGALFLHVKADEMGIHLTRIGSHPVVTIIKKLVAKTVNYCSYALCVYCILVCVCVCSGTC